jgi:hypothetical protein
LETNAAIPYPSLISKRWLNEKGGEKMPRGPKTLDDILLRVLEGGPATVNDIVKCFERRVRIRLDKLRVRGVVVREGRGRAHREFTYRLLRPDLAAKALSEKGGGLSHAAKETSERGSGPRKPGPKANGVLA